jgi:hypothetical protein
MFIMDGYGQKYMLANNFSIGYDTKFNRIPLNSYVAGLTSLKLNYVMYSLYATHE